MQVIAIHGAGSFMSLDRKDFLAALKTRDVSLESMRPRTDWKGNLQKSLGPAFDVIAPRMPDTDRPQYEAWKTWFTHIAPLFDDEVILIGHSLGGLFLVKYLSENQFSKKVKALYLVASPYTGPEASAFLNASLVDGGWLLSDNLARVGEQCERIVALHSTDDPIVPYASLQAFKTKLGAEAVTLNGQGHVRGESLPELEQSIRGLSV